MDLNLLARDFGAAAFTLAPTDPETLLADIGVEDPSPVDEPAAQLHEHHQYAWSLEQSPSDEREPPLIICRPVGPGWSLALEVDGTTGWVGCTRSVLEHVSAQRGIVYSAYFDQDDAQIMVSRNGEHYTKLDVVSGRQWGDVNEDARSRLRETGFGTSGRHGLSPQLKAQTHTERLDTLFNAVSAHSINGCLVGGDWIAGTA